MHVKIHAADKVSESKGKTTVAWNEGDVTCEQVTLSNGQPGLKIECGCSELIGTGERSYRTQPKVINRVASIYLSPGDIQSLASGLAEWRGRVPDTDATLAHVLAFASNLLAAGRAAKVGKSG